ncbi:Blue copper protein [Quillaja saponaria]|uniref:Blue copper protein n=1 Tax=Quillaja saponaria TaxID=32244 RepID=A0AAD7PNP8_QUISA|nr:Blue copper protein [Quillaja saponaria]
MTLAAALLVLLLAVPTVYGVDHIVGDNTGWSLQGDYKTYAAGQTFRVGDNLVFNYDSNHKVDVVDEDGYNSCSSSNALQSHGDGNTKIPLTSPGKMYFICPTIGHCTGGMKLAIDVVAATSGTSPTTPASPSPPSGSTTPGTSTTNSPPPPHNGGDMAFSAMNRMMLGSTLVVSTILAFIC